MKNLMILCILLCANLLQGVSGENRILSEISDTNSKWQFEQFSTQVEQNMETIVLPNNLLLFVQSQVDEQGVKKLTIQKYQRDGTKLGAPLIIGDSSFQCSRPKVVLIKNIGFGLGWIGNRDKQSSIYFQIFNYELVSITNQEVIGEVHLEVHWDMVSEFHYFKELSGTKLQIFYKHPSAAKTWNGFVYDYNDNSRTELITLRSSKVLDIAINKIGTIVVQQVIQNETRFTIMNLNGQILRTEFSNFQQNNLQTQRKITALSNNNFAVLTNYQGWSTIHIYDSRFSTILQTNAKNYYNPATAAAAAYASWEYYDYFVGGQIQFQALEESFVIVGVDIYSLQFRLVHLKNSLDFIQFREVHYDNLNIYKYFIQKTNENTIFVQWIYGQPETLLPEYKQFLYQSELNLSLSLNQCSSGCAKCLPDKTCLQCQKNYNLVDSKCQLQCIENCKQCSNLYSCEICNDGYFFDYQLKCVQSISNIQEVRISNSETTNKRGSKFRVLDNRNIVIIYREQDQQKEIMQVKLLNQNGNTLQQQQLTISRLLNFDIIIQDSKVFVYIMEQASDNYGKIIIYKYSTDTLQLESQIQLPMFNNLNYFDFQNFYTQSNFFEVIQFTNTFTIVFSGYSNYQYQRVVSVTYDWSGNLKNSQFYGDCYTGNLFQYNSKQFDVLQYDNLMYVLVIQQCSIYLMIIDENGNIVKQETPQYYNCQFLINPSISRNPESDDILVAFQDASKQIQVYSWFNYQLIYNHPLRDEVQQPELIALNYNSFILLYLKNNHDANYRTLNYLHYVDGQIVSEQIINSQTIQPTDVTFATYYDNDYIFVAWTGFKNLMEIQTNQIYLQQISVNDNKIVGLVLICGPNCSDCDENSICNSCSQGYQLTIQQQCQLACLSNCYYCEEVNVCQICNVTYKLNSENQCILNDSTFITKLKQNNNGQDFNQQITITSESNIIVTWTSFDILQNRYRSFFKSFDQYGKQLNEQMIDICRQQLQIKAFTMNELNLIAILCDNSEFYLAIQEADFLLQVLKILNIDLINTIPSNNHFDIVGNDFNQIFLITQSKNNLNEWQNYRINVYCFIFDPYNNIFLQQCNEEKQSFEQQLQYLSIQASANFIYYQYTYPQFDSNTGINLVHTVSVKTDYNYYEIQNEFIDYVRIQVMLKNSDILQVTKLVNEFSLKILSGVSQIISTQIKTDQNIGDFDVTSFQHGFVIAWIQTDVQQTIRAQVFFNNGTQITNIQQLASFSVFPSYPKIKSLKNGEFIIVWSDIDSTGKSIFAARYNKYLSQIPLTSVICEEPCDVCLTSTSCQRCYDGYYVDGQTCKPQCSGECIACSVPYTCDICWKYSYMQDNQCYQDQFKLEEEIVSKVQNIYNTRVSITSFSDTSFVVAWNDNPSGVQSIFLQFYDTQRKPSGNVKVLQGKNDRLFGKMISLVDDKLAIIWFDGDCSVQCRLILQIFDEQLSEYTTETLIALVSLPVINNQSPVQIKRQDNKLIIAYLSYENSKTTSYYTIYHIETLSLLNPTQVESSNVQVDNMDIIVYNSDLSAIVYVVNNTQLKALINRSGVVSYVLIYDNTNTIETPTHVVIENSGHIALAWSEKQLTNVQYVNKIVVLYIDNQFNQISNPLKIESYHQEHLEMPKLLGKINNNNEIDLFYRSFNSTNKLNKKIMVNNIQNFAYVSQRQQKITWYSYEHQYFQMEQLQYQEYILVDVGFNSQKLPTIFIMRLDNSGNQIKMGDIICSQHCLECKNNHSCMQCEDGYDLFNNQYCYKRCEAYQVACDSGYVICASGYRQDPQNECVPLDPEKSQVLINTNKFLDQEKQNIATLSNYYSIVVWQSNQQNLNGVSIYMQKFDPQFKKVGEETLITKDAIGVQLQPNIAALHNNQFVIIWKDSNQDDIQRIIMQKFSFNFEKIGNEVVVYDYPTSSLFQQAYYIEYYSINYELKTLQNGNLAVLLNLGYNSEDSYQLINLTLKLFDSNLVEYHSQLIAQSVCCGQSYSIATTDNIIFITWTNELGELKILSINSDGNIVNGKTLAQVGEYVSCPCITVTELGYLSIAWVKSILINIQLFDLQLNTFGDPYQINLFSVIIYPKSTFQQYYVYQLNMNQIQGGIVLTFLTYVSTQSFLTQAAIMQLFDNYLIATTSLQQINDYRGFFDSIKSQNIGNGQFVVIWQQWLEGDTTQNNVIEKDSERYGLYVKRFDSSGKVQPITNVVCQTYCNQCSKDNLCESCLAGFVFDQTHSICEPKCPENCQNCYQESNFRSYCNQCNPGYVINGNKGCDKIQDVTGNELYLIGEKWSSANIIDQLTLQNGNIVIIYSKFEFKEIKFQMIDNQGIVIINEQKIWDGEQVLVRATALTQGHFAVIHRSFYTSGQDNNIWLHVYDVNGVEIRSKAIVNYALWNYYYNWNQSSTNQNILAIKSLSNGGFLIIYMNDNNGRIFLRPQLYLRVYNSEFWQDSNDILLKTEVDNVKYEQLLYLNWWSQNSNLISILETQNNIIVLYQFVQYYWWNQDSKKFQIIKIDKLDFTQVKIFIDIDSNHFLLWWHQQHQTYQLLQIEQNKFLIFRPFPQGFVGIYLDAQFQIIEEKIIRNTFEWLITCPGCCSACWNQQQFQLIQLDNSLMLSYYSQECYTYQCLNTAKIMAFTFNLEQLNGPKQIQYIFRNQLTQSNKNIMRKYQNNQILMMSVLRIDDSLQAYVQFDKLDSKGNKILKWSLNCPVECRSCVNENQQIKCLDCQDQYYMDDDQTCKLNCQFEHCLYCSYSGMKQQYCSQCEEGYQIKDNQYCVQKDPNQIVEEKLQISEIQNSIPQVATFSDGTIIAIHLQQIKQNFIVYGQILTQNGDKIGEMKELIKSTRVIYFDLSISSKDEIFIVWTDFVDFINIRGQRYDKNITPILEQIQIYSQQTYTYNIQFATVEYLKDDTLIVLLFGGKDLFMTKFDVNFNNNGLQYVDNISYYEQWVYDWNWLDYYSYYSRDLPYQAPQVVSNENYFVILYQRQWDQQALELRTYDYNQNNFAGRSFKYQNPTQPSIAFLENGNLALVWKDTLQSYNIFPVEIPSYQQSALIYVITDPLFNSIQYKYFGLDYVNEEKPDIQAIPNGFAVSFSGKSEKNSQSIDLRVVYFDLSGIQQTGFITVSFISKNPTNSQLASQRDGSVFAVWYSNFWIYMQKLDRNGILQPLNTIICTQSCSSCVTDNTCDKCLNGYQLNQYGSCEEVCLIENCSQCSYWGNLCGMCNIGYIQDESLAFCKQIDLTQNREKQLSFTTQILSSKVFTDSLGDIIDLWIDYSSETSSYQLYGRKYSAEGSLITDTYTITQLSDTYNIQAVYNEQYQISVLLLINYNSVKILKLNDQLEVVGEQISLYELLKQEYPIDFYTSSLSIKNYHDGFAIVANGYKKKIIDQFSVNPRVIVCQVPEILLFDLNGKLVIPSITFWSNDRLSNGFLDGSNQCYNWIIQDLLFEEYIYIILSNQQKEESFLQIYDYNGQKIRERRLSDFIPAAALFWWRKISISRLSSGDFIIIGPDCTLRINSQLDYLNQEYLDIPYQENNLNIVTINNQYLAIITRQLFYQVNRYKLYVYDLYSKIRIYSDLISQSAISQGAFTYIKQNNGNLLFSWQENGQNSINYGKQIIVRFDQTGQAIKFEQFSCLTNCDECTVATKCTVCSVNYHLDSKQSCIPICSDNCKTCTSPLTCDICNYGYYSNDNQQCQSKDGQGEEKLMNGQTSSSQIHARVAHFSDGSSVIVWQSDSQDGSGFGVYARKIDSAGNKIGDEIRVSINVKGSQYFPDVTTLSNGNTIIIWVDGDIETIGQLYYQQFDNDMKRIGNPVFVDNITVPWISYFDVPCVVQNLNGKSFAIIWINFDSNGNQMTFVTVIDDNGVRGITNSINNYDSNKEIVVSSNGMNLVIIYNRYGEITGSIFDLNGGYQATQMIVPAPASSPGITVNNNGQYIITWQSGGVIRYQIFDSQLYGLGAPLQTDIISNAFSDNPDIIAQSNGFVIVWQNADSQGSRSRKIRIQLFDISGTSQGSSIEVDVDTVYGQYPQLSLLNNDEFVVIWNAQNIDQTIDEASGIYMMKFSSTGVKQSIGGIICPNRCQNCSTQEICIKCVEDYILSASGICLPQCADNCGICSGPQSCDICSDGFQLNPSGQCSKIIADQIPEDPLLSTPLSSLPSFSSSQQVNTGLIVYAGSVVQVGVQFYLEINLQLIDGSNSNQFIQKIPVASTTSNIIHSDVIVREDNSIQVYWVEIISKVIRIKVITISYEFVVIEEETVIDTIYVTDNGQVHDESRVYLYYQNAQYFVIHSVYSNINKYDVFQHSLSTSYIRVTQPTHIMLLSRQITYTQVLFSIDSVIFLEFSDTYYFRTYKFSIDFVSLDLKETLLNYGQSNYANSFMLRRLKENNYVVCWKSSTTHSLSSRSYIYQTILNSDLYRISDFQYVTQSNGELGNPLIIVQDDRFAVIWNNQISVSYSQLSISYYNNYGGYISTTTQLNTVSNNIQYYFATITIKQEIVINWVSKISVGYQYYISIVDKFGKLVPSPTLVCQTKCLTCNNKFTCLTCASNYYMDQNDCLPLCPVSCKQCDIPTACTVCKDGYTLNKTTQQCEKNPCLEGCKTCNLLQQCLECEKNYNLNSEDTTRCIPFCPLNCAGCTVVPVCDKCNDSYYWSNKVSHCVVFEDAILEHPRENPLIATFPTGDYVEMWNQEGVLSGIYFQLYRYNKTMIGGPTKVNTDTTSGNRRLLQNEISGKTLFSDLATFQDEFVVVWVDQTIGDLKVKFKKFNIKGEATSDEITIRELPKQNLEQMAAPCQVKKTQGENFVVGFLQQIEEQVATMFIQSFNKYMEPIGKLQTLATDYTKAAMISATEDGRISITFSSNGYVYLTQISMEGNYLYEPMKVADGKAFKSTNLKNNKIVFVFEAVTMDISPPQYILQYEIMDADKKLSEPVTISSPQSGEEHPFVTTIGVDFIVAWRTVDNALLSQDIIFQIFDEFGNKVSPQIKVNKQGLYPKNPSVQILNDDDFYITWTGQTYNSTDGFYVQPFKRSVLTKNILQRTICSSNCLNCENSTLCNTCSEGYYEENGYCQVKCGNNCLECSKPNECNLCEEGYFFNSDNKCQMIDCEQGYKLDENYECVPDCSENCQVCESFNVCLKCQEQFILGAGRCYIIEQPIQPTSNFYILRDISIGLVFSIVLMVIIWYYKKKTQTHQVVDVRQEQYLDSTVN